jgi:predicted DNA-binding antitoxin AbrB/MazE fold protein
MSIQAKIKKWGNSMGIIIPVDFLKINQFKEGDEVLIEIKKKNNLKDIFGSWKGKKLDAQKFKDEIREEGADD